MGKTGRLVRWYQRADLAKHTAVLAALVAAISLAITAWGTYKSAQVADDQLKQSREEDENSQQAQASRFTAWVERDKIVIANRNLDPVSGYIFVSYGKKASGRPAVVTYVDLGVVPPCTAVRLPREVVYARADASSKYTGIARRIAGLHFTTSDGQSWDRWNRKGGELTSTADVPPPQHFGAVPDDKGLMDHKEAKISALTQCGGAK
ncbi:hypothetical protein [Streptomyces ardesiacus]|uniref:hypothetical protein n=1 Tax=Streptomyces ardesiacus TaxID=285564 RepID=UPI00131F288B|nr:hypothetical protein [Streptomyces ardesiacus]